MAYFTDFQDYFFLCSDISSEEKRKLNDYLQILETPLNRKKFNSTVFEVLQQHSCCMMGLLQNSEVLQQPLFLCPNRGR